MSDNKGISRAVVKKDHAEKMEGRSLYVSDYKTARDGRPILTGKLLRSEKARARVLAVELPELPAGYLYVDASDIPGENKVFIVTDDTPVFCRETVEYIGEPIGMLVGPDGKEVKRLLSQIRVRYEELEPVLDLRRAVGETGPETAKLREAKASLLEAVKTVSEMKAENTDAQPLPQIQQDMKNFAEFDFGHGDLEQAFRSADRIFEEEFETGYQEHAYLETQGMLAEPGADGKMFVHGSMQCPYYVKGAVAFALGCGFEDVRIMQDATGGGFGGKESFPSILAAQTAVAAREAGAPVRCVLDRREDMAFSCKRHPSVIRVRMAVKDGSVTGADFDIVFNAGAYSTLSYSVLMLGAVTATGVYHFPAIHIRARAAKTNTVPCDAFRGFGGVQTAFAVERMMDHVAAELGTDGIAFKKAHFVKQGAKTTTDGIFHFPVPLEAMIEEVDAAWGLKARHAACAKPQTGRCRRGVGSAFTLHGNSFTGTAERDLVRSVVRLHKYPDGRVEVLADNTDIGQGVRTTFPKIVAHELDLPLEKVFYRYPDTARVPDSGSTSASRSVIIVGELLRRAAAKLREQWREGEEQETEEHYAEPPFTIPLNVAAMQGDAYPDYSWSVSAVEVEVDTFTGCTRIVDAVACVDAGTPIDEAIVRGQIEGGFLQGLGFASMEQMDCDSRGLMRNISFSDYLIPTAVDLPKIHAMLYSRPYPYGPFGAKGVGEIPLVGALPAYAAAVEQALGTVKYHVNHVPFTAEDIEEALRNHNAGETHDKPMI